MGGVIEFLRSSVIHPETFATDYVLQGWHHVRRYSCAHWHEPNAGKLEGTAERSEEKFSQVIKEAWRPAVASLSGKTSRVAIKNNNKLRTVLAAAQMCVRLLPALSDKWASRVPVLVRGPVGAAGCVEWVGVWAPGTPGHIHGQAELTCCRTR